MCLTIIIDCISIHKLFIHIYNKRNMDLFQVLNLINIIISELLNIRNICDVEFHMYFEEQKCLRKWILKITFQHIKS